VRRQQPAAPFCEVEGGQSAHARAERRTGRDAAVGHRSAPASPPLHSPAAPASRAFRLSGKGGSYAGRSTQGTRSPAILLSVDTDKTVPIVDGENRFAERRVTDDSRHFHPMVCLKLIETYDDHRARLHQARPEAKAHSRREHFPLGRADTALQRDGGREYSGVLQGASGTLGNRAIEGSSIQQNVSLPGVIQDCLDEEKVVRCADRSEVFVVNPFVRRVGSQIESSPGNVKAHETNPQPWPGLRSSAEGGSVPLP
jgi:hypothetical protein